MNTNLVQTKEKPILTIIRWLGTLVSLGVMVYLLSKVGWKQALDSFGQIPWWTFVIFLIFGLGSRISTFARWHSLLRASGELIDPKDSLKLTFAGLFSSNILPSTIGGDIFRLAGAICIGISASLAAASLVVDRLVGMTGMFLALPLALKFLPFLREASSLPAMGLAVGTGVFSKFFAWLRRNINNTLQSLTKWLRQPTSLAKALGFTIIHQAFTYIIIKVFVTSMGEDIPILTIAGIWSLIYFITLLPVSINGLGLQEISVTNLFSTLGGISIETSIALAIFLRILWMLVSLPGAFFIGDILAGKQPTKQGEHDTMPLEELPK